MPPSTIRALLVMLLAWASAAALAHKPASNAFVQLGPRRSHRPRP